MTLEFTIVHLSPLVNSYKGRDYFSAFVFYSANLKEYTEIHRNARAALVRASGLSANIVN